jgi:hypothetical protein
LVTANHAIGRSALLLEDLSNPRLLRRFTRAFGSAFCPTRFSRSDCAWPSLRARAGSGENSRNPFVAVPWTLFRYKMDFTKLDTFPTLQRTSRGIPITCGNVPRHTKPYSGVKNSPRRHAITRGNVRALGPTGPIQAGRTVSPGRLAVRTCDRCGARIVVHAAPFAAGSRGLLRHKAHFWALPSRTPCR